MCCRRKRLGRVFVLKMDPHDWIERTIAKTQYVEYIANPRLKALGYDAIFDP